MYKRICLCANCLLPFIVQFYIYFHSISQIILGGEEIIIQFDDWEKIFFPSNSMNTYQEWWTKPTYEKKKIGGLCLTSKLNWFDTQHSNLHIFFFRSFPFLCAIMDAWENSNDVGDWDVRQFEISINGIYSWCFHSRKFLWNKTDDDDLSVIHSRTHAIAPKNQYARAHSRTSILTHMYAQTDEKWTI